MLNLLIKIINAPFAGLWLDEAFSILMARRSLSEITFLTLRDFNPPLYYYFLHYWMKVFGDSPIATRIPSLIAYLGFGYLIYKSLKLIEIKKPDIWLYTLFAISAPSVMYFSIEIRMYMIQATLVLLSLILIYKKSWYFILVNIALLYLHSASLFYVVGIYLYLIFLYKSDKALTQRLIVFNTLSLISYAPWMILFIKAHANLKLDNPWARAFPNPMNILNIPGKLYAGISYIPDVNYVPVHIFIAIFFFVCFFIYLKKDYLLIKKDISSSFYLLVLLTFIGSILAATAASIHSGTFYWRYMWFSIGPFILILLVYFQRSVKKPNAKYLILGFVVFINLMYFGKFATYQKLKIPDNLKELKENELVISQNLGDLFPLKYYYGENKVRIVGTKNFETVPKWYGSTLMTKSDFIFGDANLNDYIGTYPSKTIPIKIVDQSTLQ